MLECPDRDEISVCERSCVCVDIVRLEGRNFNAYAPKDIWEGRALIDADELGIGEALWVSFIQPKRKKRNMKNEHFDG